MGLRNFETASSSVIDVGCGEGWLVRRLSGELRCRVIGIGQCEPLIDEARRADACGEYAVVPYERLAELKSVRYQAFDAAVCNFALLDEDLLSALQAIREVLSEDGHLVIQTLHPQVSDDGDTGTDGWREETFAMFRGGRWQPMPWYFRTLESWYRQIEAAGFKVANLKEPRDPCTGVVLSIIFFCSRR